MSAFGGKADMALRKARYFHLTGFKFSAAHQVSAGGCHSIRLVGSPSSFFGELLWHAPVSMVLPVLAPYVELAAIRSEWAANAYIGSPSFAWRGVLIRVASH